MTHRPTGIRTLLLVQPPARGLLDGFANGLIDLANYVRFHEPNIDVRIIDLGWQRNEEVLPGLLEALHGVQHPVMIGVTTTTATYQAALVVARAAKAAQPGCITVLGGHHVSPQHETVLRHHHSYVDFVVRGEGEAALLALARDPTKAPLISGVSRWDGRQVRAQRQGALLTTTELDRLPPFFPGHTPRSAAGKFEHATYVSARGCPLRCTFCAVAGERTRAKSIPRVIEDLELMVKTCGYRKIAIEDNFFAQTASRTLELCAAIEALQRRLPTPFTWDCQTRVESLRRREIPEAMARAGCEAVYLGVEALTVPELHHLGKTAVPESYLRLLSDRVLPSLLELGINAHLNLQVGLPGETEDTLIRQLAVLAELGELAAQAGRTLTVFPQLHVLYPGTALFSDACSDHAFGTDADSVFEHFTSWELKEEPILNFLGENFAHGVGGIPIGILRPDLLPLGQFEVDPGAVARIKKHLDRMDALPGVTVFRYGAHLAGRTHQELGASPLETTA